MGHLEAVEIALSYAAISRFPVPVTPTPAAPPLDPNHAITFLGGGNMAAALIGGLLRNGHTPSAISVIETDPSRAARLAADYGVDATATQPGRLSHQIVVLAVKPQQMHDALRNLRVAPDCTVVSIAAGLTVEQLAVDLPQGCAIVRCMPNSPALVGAGMTVLFAPKDTSDAARAQAEAVLATAGPCEWLDDELLLDAVTAISGSGPAYFFRFAEALAASGEALGLPANLAARLARQTLIGAGALVREQADDSLATLRANVTSKGGTTEAALAAFEDGQLTARVHDAALAAAQRSLALRTPAPPSTGSL